MPIVQDIEANAAAGIASIEEGVRYGRRDPTDAARPTRQAKKAAMEKAVWRPRKRSREDALPARRTPAKRQCSSKGNRNKGKGKGAFVYNTIAVHLNKSHGSNFLLSSPPPPTKAKRSQSDDSENEPVDIPVPSAPKKVRKSRPMTPYRDDSDQEGSDSGQSASESDGTLSPVREDDRANDNVFDDGTPATAAHEGGIRLDEAAITAFARRVLAERPLWATQAEPNMNANAAFSVHNHGPFSDDDGVDAESPTASLSSNKENLPPVLTPTPSPPEPPAAPPTTPSSDVNNTNTRWPWPYYTELVYHQTNSGLDLGLSRQHFEIKLVVRRAIETITENIIFEDAFPSPAVRAVWIHKALIAATNFAGEMSSPAVRTRYDRIHSRIIQEHQFETELSTMIIPRMPLLRSQIKTLAVSNATKSYQLQGMDVGGIASLVKDYKYIFPLGRNNNVQGSKPYENVAIISTMRDFLSHHSSISERFLAGKDVLTPSIIALASTAVAAAIDEWRTGRHIVGTFTSNIYADVYNNHIAILVKIQSNNKQGYDALLRRLYLAAVSSNNGMETVADVGSTFLDVANMAVDV
ncbi:hypothetical protein M378DRAFT_18429 [Amanita muscaria Koide BX008]|uniref:DUF6532 domain-containing protein n=1 Tax=Amanita muscaria (strain Koide BX008) TaxID=946122 RepID=A0A0C2RX75_AMAMK|nr:hypothetical protein M378DRAFT_18429 [Amanita muscaria Koide BX008]